MCSNNVIASIDIWYMQGTHRNTIRMTMRQKVSINKTKQ